MDHHEVFRRDEKWSNHSTTFTIYIAWFPWYNDIQDKVWNANYNFDDIHILNRYADTKQIVLGNGMQRYAAARSYKLPPNSRARVYYEENIFYVVVIFNKTFFFYRNTYWDFRIYFMNNFNRFETSIAIKICVKKNRKNKTKMIIVKYYVDHVSLKIRHRW